MSVASGGTDADKVGSDDTRSPVGRRESSAHPAVDCRVVHESGNTHGGVEEEEPHRCLPLTPLWWPVDLDPTTGKVPS
ncbi:unnamed protein product [Hapterophycus canaliculatus]